MDAAASGSRAEETTRLLLASGYGLLFTWTLLLYHSLLLFRFDTSPIYGMQLSRFLSLLGALAVLVVARATGSSKFVARPVVAGAAGAAALGTLLIASGRLLGAVGGAPRRDGRLSPHGTRPRPAAARVGASLLADGHAVRGRRDGGRDRRRRGALLRGRRDTGPGAGHRHRRAAATRVALGLLGGRTGRAPRRAAPSRGP